VTVRRLLAGDISEVVTSHPDGPRNAGGTRKRGQANKIIHGMSNIAPMMRTKNVQATTSWTSPLPGTSVRAKESRARQRS
jgi:hypothetical protein